MVRRGFAAYPFAIYLLRRLPDIEDSTAFSALEVSEEATFVQNLWYS
uniref:Uncharacterized protein n=1 Tax=Arundo donax TaxID=35708 RepID=A0A0A9DJ28_ARUDO